MFCVHQRHQKIILKPVCLIDLNVICRVVQIFHASPCTCEWDCQCLFISFIYTNCRGYMGGVCYLYSNAAYLITLVFQYSTGFVYSNIHLHLWLKLGSQWNYDASPLLQIFVTVCKNAVQRNTRIEPESILALLCIVSSVNMKATQCNASSCIVDRALSTLLVLATSTIAAY